jgi:hypothetical protein
MALIAMVAGLVVVDLLALRFGYDSRNTRSGGLRSDWHRQ